MNTAHQQWLEFSTDIGIQNLNHSSAQYIETRRAFYAGMLSGVRQMRDTANDNPETPQGEARAMEQMETFLQEIVAFFERVKRGIS